MNIIPFLFLTVGAVAAFLDWYVNTPRKFASHSLALFLFIVGVILVFTVTGHPLLHIETGK